ncbi:TPA: acetamidase/formamidase family protein [Legionella pneumophila]|uniref:acetamidase/formamidase family protein n=1 Tax=Legionella pneumophila TaxID=446 RepID=UPI0005CA19F1|nr:acetamidase/formamidase family protein [Legionella pneumophila]HAT8827215.1 acetamidase [Legionella pneumophila subsp. pneumophila]MDW8853402.1 acetamidase/formamidase family protein [Legionella pneumophila]MDW8921952.1 acetamidase/formamidase family protein [Legionella pneumophila]MDW8926888.1 acetamidase/formamidase family protein [Legionella pneumophila]MDX1864731.1 acetamidase/formamidase family protein [Legionella pneumophila]
MLNKIRAFSLLIAIVFFSNVSAETYKVPATKDTVTLGLFTLDKTPVVKVHSGDSVSLETWNSCLHEMVFNKTTPAEIAKFYTKHDIQKRRGMHSLTGPVYVEGAEPGDVLEIRVLDIKLNDFGYNFLSPTQGILSEFTKPRIMYFKYDKEKNTTEFTKGICLHLKPFPGIIAVAPPLDWPDGWPVNLETQMGQPVPGQFNSVPPGPFGGNLDEPSLQVGSILYLPVFQKGALVWTGDSHAMQSNGEIDVTALETSFEGITLQFIVRKDLKAEGVFDKTKRNGNSLFTWPIVENSEEWIIIGLHENLFEAMQLASKNAIEFLVRTQGLSSQESYQFLSMVGNFDIPEAVNVIKSVAVHIPKEIFKNTGKITSLSSEGKFPLTTPRINENTTCVPQEGKIIE